jgi:hypothetical protein
MPLDLDVIAKLLAPIITALVGVIAKWYFEEKPKLISYLVHTSAIPLNDSENTLVHTHSIVVRNAGKKAAHNVRIGHFVLPSFQVSPPVSHTVILGANNSGEIVIPTLVPNDQVSIAYLYFPPLVWSQINAYAKSDEGHAKIINFIPTPQPSKFILFVVWALVFLGASTALYWAFLFVAGMVMPGA